MEEKEQHQKAEEEDDKEKESAEDGWVLVEPSPDAEEDHRHQHHHDQKGKAKEEKREEPRYSEGAQNVVMYYRQFHPSLWYVGHQKAEKKRILEEKRQKALEEGRMRGWWPNQVHLS